MNFLSTKRRLSLMMLSLVMIAGSAVAATMQEKLAELEASTGGRIGVYAINTANDQLFQHRADERFPMGCTSKVIGVATILNQSVKDKGLLSQKINYDKKDLVEWSPITEKNLSTGMTVEQLCAAALRYSDNTAMNLLVQKMGGLAQMNSFAHKLGNASFRQDNGWVEEAWSGGKGNVKDSSTPKDMAKSLQKLVLANGLAEPQRQMLLSWLKANTTGSNRIRAAVPKGWVVADKTGTGSAYGTTNDIGIVWPPKSAPIVMAIYYTNDDKSAVKREDIVASVARVVIDTLANSPRAGLVPASR